MEGANTRTLAAIFEVPTRTDLKWAQIEALLIELGADVRPGRKSRFRVSLNGRRGVFHIPDPSKEVDRGTLTRIRYFLSDSGVEEP